MKRARLIFAAIGILVAPIAAFAQDAAPEEPVQLAPEQPDGTVGSPTQLAPAIETTLALSATLVDEGPTIGSGLVWRVYSAQPNENGQYPLIVKTDQALPNLQLSTGSYVVHAAYGRAQATRLVSIDTEPLAETLNLNAGGLRLWADLGRGVSNVVSNVAFKVYSTEKDEYGESTAITDVASIGKVLRLSAGAYHVVSQYGNANATVRADVKVEPGKITDATIIHRAANVTMKLVNEAGGEALANTTWNVLTPGGDTVIESIGAFPTHVLAAGDYEAIARHEGQVYNKTFNVEPGIDREVELVAQ